MQCPLFWKVILLIKHSTTQDLSFKKKQHNIQTKPYLYPLIIPEKHQLKTFDLSNCWLTIALQNTSPSLSISQQHFPLNPTLFFYIACLYPSSTLTYMNFSQNFLTSHTHFSTHILEFWISLFELEPYSHTLFTKCQSQ